MKRYIKATEELRTVGCSFDFINDGEYDYRELERAIEDAVQELGYDTYGVDFRDVDYSNVPEYRDEIITQGGVDITSVEDPGMQNYIEEDIKNAISTALDRFGYELIGIDFYSVD